MENIELKPKKKNFLNKITDIFEDKKKRYLYMMLFILPFIIIIGIFGFITYKEAKNLKDLVSGTVEIKDENNISSMKYILRDNATDIQKEYFAELKQAVEIDNASNETISGLVCKNFVADFYTWTNKQGQFDVGGMPYIYDMETTKNTTYMKARDGFYKYISTYIKEYGKENLLEVANVQVDSVTKLPYEYKCLVNTHCYDDEQGHYYQDIEYDYDGYEVKCTWTYVDNSKFNTSSYATSMYFIVVENNGRYEIVEASEKQIDAKDPRFEDDDKDKDTENSENQIDDTDEEKSEE